MWLRITSLLSFLFPQTEDEKNIAELTPATFVQVYSCRNVDGVYVLSSFKQKEVRSAVHLNKFHNHKHAQALLGALLAQFLNTYTVTESALLIPIPLSSVRKRKRGHNQVESVLKNAHIDKARFNIDTHLLKKVLDTPPQTSLDKEARKKNLKGAYVFVEDERQPVNGKHIILIDDVMTTGTTLKEAKHALLKGNPASVLCVALAH